MSPAWRSARNRVLLTCSPSPAVATGPTTSTPNPRRAPRPRHRAADDRLMAQVRAVEVAEREDGAGESLGPAHGVADDAHRHPIIYMTLPGGRRLGERRAGSAPDRSCVRGGGGGLSASL